MFLSAEYLFKGDALGELVQASSFHGNCNLWEPVNYSRIKTPENRILPRTVTLAGRKQRSRKLEPCTRKNRPVSPMSSPVATVYLKSLLSTTHPLEREPGSETHLTKILSRPCVPGIVISACPGVPDSSQPPGISLSGVLNGSTTRRC